MKPDLTPSAFDALQAHYERALHEASRNYSRLDSIAVEPVAPSRWLTRLYAALNVALTVGWLVALAWFAHKVFA